MNQKNNNDGNKTKVKTLINRGLFDDHIEELSKALYTNRLFTKDIKCYFNKINNNKIDNSLNPKNNKDFLIKNKKSRNNINKYTNISLDKKISTDINSYELNKHKEDDINNEMQKLLKLLNISQDETYKQFQKIKNENDFFSKLYKLYKDLIDRTKKNNNSNNDNDDNSVFMFLYDLLIKYKSKKNLTFNINSLFSDILRETPLATNDPEKLKFHYIINSERFDNLGNNSQNMNIKKSKKSNPLLAMFNYHSADNSLTKIKMPKEPKTIDMTKIENLKEIKFLNKVNKSTKYKIIMGGKQLMGFTPLRQVPLESDKNILNKRYKKKEVMEQLDENQFNSGIFENSIDKVRNKPVNLFSIKMNKKRLKLDIDKDIIDINILKKTIKDSFQFEKKGALRLRKTKSLFFNDTKRLSEREKKKSNLSSFKNNKSYKKTKTIISKDKFITFNKKFNILEQKINRSDSIKLTKSSNFNTINDKNENDNSNLMLNNTPFTSQNNYLAATYYTNLSNSNINNYSNLNHINPNITANFETPTPKKKIKFFEQNLMSSSLSNNNLFNSTISKAKKNRYLNQSKSVFPYEKCNSGILDNILNHQTENIYSISKKINGKNSKASIKKIKDYLSYKNSRLPILYKGNTFKDTYYFLNRIKNNIQNNEIKYKFQNVKKMLNDKEKKKLNDIVLLESNLVNKEKELLTKILRNKI